MLTESPSVCWLLIAVEVVGLASAWVVRLSAGSRRQIPYHCLLLGCMGLVGATVPLSLGLGPSSWLASSVTLALMILTVTCDFRPSRHSAIW